jgi:alpha-1,2-mannosyltransferase
VATLIGCWALLRQRRDALAGVLLGLACLIKLFPGLIVLYLLMRRRWLAGVAALGTVAIGSLLTLLLVGPGDMLDYFVRMAPQDSAVHGLSPINVALAGVIRRLLSDGPWVNPLIDAPLLATGLVGMASLGALIVLLRYIGRMAPTVWSEDRAFALVCVAMLLISPITWWHVFPLLLLPFGLLLQDLQARPDRWKLGLSLLALALVSLPDLEIARALMGLYAPYRIPWFAGLLLALPTIGLTLLWWAVANRSHVDAFSSEG